MECLENQPQYYTDLLGQKQPIFVPNWDSERSEECIVFF